MDIIVTGGRDYQDHVTVDRVLSAIEFKRLFVGDAHGADRLAKEWAEREGFEETHICVFSADWKKHGRAAGPIRNQEMVKVAIHKGTRHDLPLLVAFPGAKGTANCIKEARSHGITVLRVWE